MTELDVVVVGGGISGLAVADGLIRRGVSVRVLEARPRVGGRMSSRAVPGGAADLGATWFWPGEGRVDALVNRLGLATHQQWNDGDALISVNGQTRRVPWKAPPAWRFSDGASSVPNALAAQLPAGVVEVGCDVQRIERTADGVHLHLSGRALSARAVVVALPPSLAIATGLVARDDLEPDLAEIASAIPVWMGHTVKVVAVYAEPFWRAAGFSGQVSSSEGPLHEIHDMSGPGGHPAMLFGFGESGPGRPEVNSSAVTEQLAGLFGQQAATPTDMMLCDWRLEQRTTPASSQPSQRYDLFGSPLLQCAAWGGRLYWASTETSGDVPGHIEGALAAAERTVQSITASIASNRIEPTT